MHDEATQFSYFRDNELTQIADTLEPVDESYKALDEGSTFLNKYTILKVLGEGSFSLIYLLEARDVSKKLLVAKEFFPRGFVTRNSENEVVLKTSLSEKEIENYHFMKEIFIGEAQNLVKVSSRTHPNVLNFFSLEENINNTMYLITDYEEGITLKAYLDTHKKEHRGKLDNAFIKKLAIGLLNGLEHIHGVDIFHQDIKLENILIRHDTTPLLLDFGASIILYDEKRKKYFNATTPRYAAPEQVDLAQPPKIDQSTDIYALGVLLYKLITDTFPPKASERLKAIEEKRKDPYISLETQKVYSYDTALLRAVDTALHLVQKERFQYARDFRVALSHTPLFTFSPLTIMGVLIPLFLLFLYLIWPTSKGTMKLNLKQKSYFVYADGKKISVSEEKTIQLPKGTHTLTIIKDGYVPYERNVSIVANTISNISARLMPINHSVLLTSNVPNATFFIDNKALTGHTFLGQYGNIYSIKTIAKNRPSKTVDINYTTLYKNNFKFHTTLYRSNIEVPLQIQKPFDIGKDTVHINGTLIKNNIFTIEDNKTYKIEVSNPYFPSIKINSNYNTLKDPKNQKISLLEGKANLILKGLYEGVNITLYQKHSYTNKNIYTKVRYSNKQYTLTIPAFDKIYLRISKQGYKTLETPVFSLKHKEIATKSYQLVKSNIKKILDNVLKSNSMKHITKASKPIVKPMIVNKDTKVIAKPVKEKTNTITNVIKKTNIAVVQKPKITVEKAKPTSRIVSKPQIKAKIIKTKVKPKHHFSKNKRKPKTKVKDKAKDRVKKNKKATKRTRTRRKTSKQRNTQHKKHLNVLKPKRNIKRKNNKKNHQRQRNLRQKSKHIWYCIAINNRARSWSAKRATRQSAYGVALRRCRKATGGFCRISSCYLWGK